MKLEKPPVSDPLSPEMVALVASQQYADFLHRMDARYLYWDEVKYRRELPFSPEKTWSLIRANRLRQSFSLPLGKYAFRYCLPSTLQQSLHDFDQGLIQDLYQHPVSAADQAEYLKHSLIEEAISSSQIEGATTTTEVALEMLKTGRDPRDHSEQMIFNNLRAIRFIGEHQQQPIDKAFIIELHQLMTVKTTAEVHAGAYRARGIVVQDFVDGEVAHIPPPAEELDELMEQLFAFANTDEPFIHPIAKASMLHFLIGFVHPFGDGNGRTARALFYWYLLRKGYAFIRHISISKAILDSRIQYDKAFLKTEYDQNDLTYFITYSIKTLRVAFDSLIRYRNRKKAEKEQVAIAAYRLMQKGLLRRQADFVGYLYVKPNATVALQAYAKRHAITRQTARRDLSQLVAMGLLAEERRGKEIVFRLLSKDRVDALL